MKIVVVKEFYDINQTTLLHTVGSEVEVSEERAKSIIIRGLGVLKKAEAPEKEADEAPAEEAPAEAPKRGRKKA